MDKIESILNEVEQEIWERTKDWNVDFRRTLACEMLELIRQKLK